MSRACAPDAFLSIARTTARRVTPQFEHHRPYRHRTMIIAGRVRPRRRSGERP